ncbi:hypothetical protein [Halorubellus sp. PRR65]|uniref:hypothetical protein n=1 Tax=Halorubellus sp. PRR65 TaxID=3098148 RepID=UPI002B25CCD7|nr:hypothetical protein [Halorubellus sp. PRR65]
MTDCEHCSESFEDEAAYLRHLDDEHPGEMGPIERRRLDELGGGDGGPSMPLVVAGIAVGALLLAVILYTLTIGGSGSGNGSELGELGPAPDPPHELGPAGTDEVYRPYSVGSAHEHGPISVNVDGQQIDFRKPEFQHPREMRAFHFESGERRWHSHARGVTLEYALEATAFGVTNTSFAYDGVVYREGSNAQGPDGWEVVTGATVVYEVNGEPVAPETYVLQNEDSITVRVEAPDDGSTNGTTTNASALA